MNPDAVQSSNADDSDGVRRRGVRRLICSAPVGAGRNSRFVFRACTASRAVIADLRAR